MGLDLTMGGHLTHGFHTEKTKVSATSVFWNWKLYQTNPQTELIDYDSLHKQALEYKPKIIVAGHSAYPRDLDYPVFKQICDDVGAYLMVDMAHISGLVAAEEANDPFKYADIVTSTTHKSLRGPRSGLIFSKKDLSAKIDQAVFPMLQGGPHNHQVGALATQLKYVNTPEFKTYIKQVKLNAKVLAADLMTRGYKLTTGGTDNHLLVMNVREKGLTGSKFEKMCDHVHITVNKNTIHGDKSAVTPGGIRVGTPAVTTRGYNEADMKEVGRFLAEVGSLSVDIQKTSGAKLKDFESAIVKDVRVKQLADEV